MDAMTYTVVRANLASTMDRVCNDHEALIMVGCHSRDLICAASRATAGAQCH